jgi:hypothetical protein
LNLFPLLIHSLQQVLGTRFSHLLLIPSEPGDPNWRPPSFRNGCKCFLIS